MSDEQAVLAASIVSKEAFGVAERFGATDDFSALGRFWFDQCKDYYERDRDASGIDVKLVRELGGQAADARHHETLLAYFDNLPLVGASPANVTASILQLQRNNTGLRLAALLTEPETANYGKVQEHIERYQELLNACDKGLNRIQYLDFDDLDNAYDPELIVQLYPKVLQTRLLGGGAMPGHHVLIYGRPEAGKSLFAINMAAGVAHSGRRVLYVGNEESVRTHGIRAACNLAGANIADYQRSSEAIKTRAFKRGLDRITFADLAPGTVGEVEEAILDTGPDLVVIDQVTGLDVRESNPVSSADKAARGVRTLLKKHSLVGVSVAQAGDRTERAGQLPPAWLSMSDVYGSRTGLPAQMDLMIGIGFDEEMFAQDIRACSLPKNKLGGNHDGFKVRIDKQKSKVKSLGADQ